MTPASTRPVTNFDHHLPELKEDVIGTFRALRELHPISWSEHYGGFWIVVAKEHVQRIARDPETFSSARPDPNVCSLTMPPSPSPLPYLPEESNPPEFLRYRQPFNALLSPSAVERMTSRVHGWVHSFVDEFIEAGRCDLAHDLAGPVPACVTLELLGLPVEYWHRYAETLHALPSSAPGSQRLAKAQEGMGQIAAELQAAIAEKRTQPQDDVVSFLIRWGEDGERFTDAELFSMLTLAVIGGVDTTASLTTHALVHLARHPEDRAKLLDDPALLESATEEFLRMYPPAMGHVRTITKDVEIGGCQMRAGERVFMSWAAANVDPEAFPDADRFVIDRFPNRHFSFGTGIHRCAGSHLARLMFKTMLTAVLDRLPDYQIDEDGLIPYPDWSTVSGWDTIPATFTPGRRVSASSISTPK